jgi:tocopherol O-methyltransferase
MISPSSPVTVGDVRDHYDELDRYYREIWGEHVHHGLWERGNETVNEAVLNLIRSVARHGEITAGKCVCDVGCGYGGSARVLETEFGATVSGITVSSAQYRYAVARRGDACNPEYLLGDWTSNTLPSDAFDTVISIESSEHMQDKPMFFAQAHRVLKTGGHMVVCAWLAVEGPTGVHQRHLLEPICREGRLPGIGTEADYRKSFSEANLELDSFEDMSVRVRKTWSICLLRVLGSVFRRPHYRQFLFNADARNRVFPLTMLRIWLAYGCGAMRYGLFKARKS